MKTIKTLIKVLVLCALLLPQILLAQTDTRHPRVAELEDQYKTQAMDFLKARFPHVPFSVVVSIVPLRRAGGENYSAKEEALPYYLLEDEEIRDEWDDPNASLYVLSKRIQSVQVIISVPSTVTEEELSEIKETLTSTLRLIPARDTVEIRRRTWSGLPNFSLYAAIGLAAIVVFLLGLYIITRFSLRRMTRVFSDLQASLGKQNQQPTVAPPSSTAVVEKSDTLGGSGSGGDFRFTDPIKIREVIGSRVHELLYSDEFPRLEDMVTLDRFAQQDHKALGALLAEFPMDMQRKLFSFGKGDYWMEAFTDPGELTPLCLQMLERLCRVQRSKKGKDWENLLIQVWRMEEQTRIRFLRQIDQEIAMAIVHPMPKNISVPTARQAFPGSWASVLDPKYKPTRVDQEHIEMLLVQATELVPPVEFEILEKYKQEKDLIAYLNTSDVVAEREIYRASPEDAMIHKIRPPFYRVLLDENDYMEDFVARVNLDDWALALFNVARGDRSNVDQHFSSKQKFIFIEKLKALDSGKLDPRAVGQARERVARYYSDFLFERTILAARGSVAPGEEGPEAEEKAEDKTTVEEKDDKRDVA
ncbi:MAG: hypothetical protein H6624_03520 [Bdellovibrionaceae bacterium]|nr:hypothetical protein [Bdellovibrionales bacterium]MCB9083384.1 hypothetical protein [Pseudobdellovibrionaceae bacterium]